MTSTRESQGDLSNATSTAKARVTPAGEIKDEGSSRERIALAVDPSRVYSFSPETGESLGRKVAGVTF